MKRQFLYRFTEQWWIDNYGLTFGRRYYEDPAYRMTCNQQMSDILQEIVPSVPSRCSTLAGGAGGVSLGGLNILAGVCGCKIHYPDNLDPWAEGPVLRTEEEMEEWDPPRLQDSGFLMDLVGQFDRLAEEYPPSEIEAYGIGGEAVVNSTFLSGYKLAGQLIFTLMYEQPELVHNFLTKVTVLTESLADFWAEKRGVRITKLFIGDCLAYVLSPHLYREFGARYNRCFVEYYNVPYGIHSCGFVTHLVQYFAVAPNLVWCEVGWSAESGQTDLVKTRQVLAAAGCRHMMVLLHGEEVLHWDEAEIENRVQHIVDVARPLDLTVRVILAEGTRPETVRALYRAVEGS